jgi:glutamate---cysteine ligase / carboxylate-amine ligase
VTGSDDTPRLHLFEAVGVEVEYAIADRATLEVRPIADLLLRGPDGEPVSEVERGPLRWSNELVCHVVELKSNGPARDLLELREAFRGAVRAIDAQLVAGSTWLVPTAMHPLMSPARDMRLWPHGQNEIYSAYDRIFDCRGHGWSNLQSMHLNLPFADDAEFNRLHAAIRVVLPLLPAIAASSPIVEGKPTGRMDTRLWYYRQNQRRIPVITGDVIPEPVFSQAEYEAEIFRPIAEALAPLDPDGILEPEWVNSRGAIARFSRGSIEIRVLDTQECPRMDIAVAALVVETVRALVEERLCALPFQKDWGTARLLAQLEHAVIHGSQAVFADPEYALLFGLPAGPVTATRLIDHLIARVAPEWATHDAGLLVQRGCLAERIRRATGPDPAPDRLRAVYSQLCECLVEDQPFVA